VQFEFKIANALFAFAFFAYLFDCLKVFFQLVEVCLVVVGVETAEDLDLFGGD